MKILYSIYRIILTLYTNKRYLENLNILALTFCHDSLTKKVGNDPI